jgi:hypothetical protein
MKCFGSNLSELKVPVLIADARVVCRMNAVKLWSRVVLVELNLVHLSTQVVYFLMKLTSTFLLSARKLAPSPLVS